MGPLVDTLSPLEGQAGFGDVGLVSTTVSGHAGRVTVGHLGPTRVVVLGGRVHMYEGRSLEEVARATRAMAAWGVERIVYTSAVGSLHLDMPPGTLVQVEDHINLSGRNPLVGPNDANLGPRFPDMTRAYDPQMAEDAHRVAAKNGIELRKGVYSLISGPSYETPAEIRALGILGADVVGMSLVPEVIAGVHAGIRVLAIAMVSNFAAGVTGEPLSHAEVTREVGKAAGSVHALLDALLNTFWRNHNKPKK
jgi:purine-nucleoside phosphorylase